MKDACCLLCDPKSRFLTIDGYLYSPVLCRVYNKIMPCRIFCRIIGRLAQTGASLLRSRHFVVVGDSMLPTLAHRQHVQTLPLAAGCRGQEAQRGAIVAFRHPERPGRVYIKRIVALPEEYVVLEGDGVLIDDAALAEPYRPANAPSPRRQRQYARQWITGQGEYFVLGDNRGDSEDSRTFGPVDRELIVGRVWFRYWPPKVWRQDGRGEAPATRND